MPASTDQTTAAAAVGHVSTEPRLGSTPPEDQILSHFHAADRATSATAELAVEVHLEVEVTVAAEVEGAEVDTADMHPSAAVASDSHSITEPGLSVPATPAERQAVLAATAAALPAAAAVAGVDADLGPVAPADTPTAADEVSADADSATEKDEAATLSGPVIVESSGQTDHTVSPDPEDITLTNIEGRSVVDDADASSSGPVQVDGSEDANACMAAELAAIFAWVNNELPKAPTEPSGTLDEPSVDPTEPPVPPNELSGTFTEHRPEVDDAQSLPAGDSQNVRMAAELTAIFALAGPLPQQSLAEPSSEASAAAGSMAADSVAADGIVAFSVMAERVIAERVVANSVVAASVVADSAAISLPLQDASTAVAEDTRTFIDTQLGEAFPAKQSSLTAPVTSDEYFLPIAAVGGLQIMLHHTPEDVSICYDFCPGMDVSSEANTPCITEHHILTAAVFPQMPQSPYDIESIRHAGDCITAQPVGKVIDRAYSHHSVAGVMFSPMVLLGTPELTLPGMYPLLHPPSLALPPPPFSQDVFLTVIACNRHHRLA